MTAFVQIILGIGLLISGRKLYWLFVGAVGFVVGLMLVARTVAIDSEALRLIIALVIGAICAGLATALQSVAVALAGFLAGGYALATLSDLIGLKLGAVEWILFVVGGILGAIFVSALLEWALMILSSIVGAVLLVQSFNVSHSFSTLLIVILFVIGVGIQASIRHREQIRSPLAEPRPETASEKKAEESNS